MTEIEILTKVMKAYISECGCKDISNSFSKEEANQGLILTMLARIFNDEEYVERGYIVTYTFDVIEYEANPLEVPIFKNKEDAEKAAMVAKNLQDYCINCKPRVFPEKFFRNNDLSLSPPNSLVTNPVW